MIPILTYHQIAPPPPKGAAFRSLCVSPNRFELQMRWLKRLGWQGLNMTQLMPYLRGERLGRVFGITFDDGYLNNLHHALPILKDLGFSATCYLVHDAMGRTNGWDANLGVAQVPLMNDQQAKIWLAAGMEVGSHTLSHVHLTQVKPEQARYEINQSRHLLSDRLQVQIRHFCYPYGDYNNELARMVQEGRLRECNHHGARSYLSS